MQTSEFYSDFHHMGSVNLPAYSGTRIMMMPIRLGYPETVPANLAAWTDLLIMFAFSLPRLIGQVGYLTIDEQLVQASQTHRRPGLHVDGVYRGGPGGWGGGGAWGGGSVGGNGLLTVSSVTGCRAWRGLFRGEPGPEGECEHLRDQLADLGSGTLLEAGEIWWLSGLCVHESIPMTVSALRQFVRLSLPSSAPWFKGYTENPLGVKPTGPILPWRPEMDWRSA